MEFPSRKRPTFITLCGAVIEDCSSHGNPCLRIDNPYRLRRCISSDELIISTNRFIRMRKIQGFNRTYTSMATQVQIYTITYFLLLPLHFNTKIKHKIEKLKTLMITNDDEKVYKEANSLSDYVKLIKNLIKSL